jgi:Survival motor neuron (SMN) interacting protein 1 (SIP1)
LNSPAAAAAAAAEHHQLDSPSSLMPELAALKGLDQVSIVTKLIETVRAFVRTSSDAASTTTTTPLPAQLPDIAAQIYALSARVERPLHADTAAAYCSLLRKCKLWRVECINSPVDPFFPHLNILISIAGGYFRQDEELSSLWDEDEEERMIEDGHNLDDGML